MTKLNKTEAKKLRQILKKHYDHQRRAILEQQSMLMNSEDAREFESKRLLSILIKDFTQTKYDSFINSFDISPTDILEIIGPFGKARRKVKARRKKKDIKKRRR